MGGVKPGVVTGGIGAGIPPMGMSDAQQPSIPQPGGAMHCIGIGGGP
jgi:hypothetical protein